MKFTAPYTRTNPTLMSQAEALQPTGMTFALCGSQRANQKTHRCVVIDASVGNMYRWIQVDRSH